MTPPGAGAADPAPPAGSLLLAIETATPQVGVALWGDAGLLASSRLAGGRRHGETLAPAVDAALRASGATVADLTAIAADVGPGLFTGLRVGLATAKALCSALGLPAVGLSSLEVIAHPHRRQGRLVAAVVDARRGEVFRAVYRPGPGGLEEVAAPAVRAPGDLAAELAGLAGAGGIAGPAGGMTGPAGGVAGPAGGMTGPAGGVAGPAGGVLAAGDGAVRYADVLRGVAEVAGPLEAHPDPAVLAEMAAAEVAAGRVTDAAGLRARYLREADVRIGWEQRPAAPPAGSRRNFVDQTAPARSSRRSSAPGADGG